MKLDLRRLPWPEQLREVRRYHRRKAADPSGDPFLCVGDIRKKFRSICPEGLFAAYCAEQEQEEARRDTEAEARVRAEVQNEWVQLVSARERRVGNRLFYEGVFERRNVREEGRKRQQYRRKLDNPDL